MQEIATAIQEGAMAYITRQFRTIVLIVIPLCVVVFFTSAKIVKDDGDVALSFAESGLYRTLAFITGAVFSGAIGFLGMWLATRGNIRTTAAAIKSDYPGALKVAIRTGGSVGLATAGLGLLGATTIILIFQNTSSAILVGFGFGGSLLALFLRVGGGIFTKAADVGADLVGKVEAGIPEDDPRNPATIADNVGDNVGDCAGMASDLFETFGVTLVASIILGVTAFNAIGVGPADAAKGLVFPVAVMALGLVASIIGIYIVKARPGETDALKAINRGIGIAQALAIVGAAVLAFGYVGNPKGPAAASSLVSSPGARMFGAVLVGVVLGFAASKITAYFTSTTTKPVQDIAKATRTGPGHHGARGHSLGLESAVWALIAVAAAIGAAIALGGGSFKFSVYLVALAGIGMLSTTGIIVAEDTFGPVADNAAGIAEMSGNFEGEPERIMVALDAVGNTTKAVTKGFAIGSAVIAAVALFASYGETIIEQLGILDARRQLVPDQRGRSQGLHRPAHRWLHRLHLLLARHPGRVPHRRRGGAGGPAPVRRRQDHERREEARLRARHRHLHRRLAPRAGHPGHHRRARPGHHRLRPRPHLARRLPGQRHRRRPAHGQLPVATPAAPGTTPRSTSRTAPRAARAPRATRPPSSATPSATRSRTPPARRSTR